MALPIVGLAITSAAVGTVARLAFRAVIVYAGVTLVGTAGMMVLLNQAGDIVRDALAQVPEGPSNILGILRFDEAVNIILYGFSIRLTLAGFKRLKFI